MIAMACDHAGLELKNKMKEYVEEMGYEVHDYGTYTKDSVDYPLYAEKAGHAVASGECDRGIIICGTGVGISIAANKIKGIRAVCCSEPYSAEMSRKHNNANMLAMGARVVGEDLAKMITKVWLKTEFEGGRHARRVDLMTKIEEQ